MGIGVLILAGSALLVAIGAGVDSPGAVIGGLIGGPSA